MDRTASDIVSTFCVGDVHGHLDRLEALLTAEGIIGECPACEGKGTLPCPDLELPDYECAKCDGNGVARLNRDVTVVQLGDLGHFGAKGDGPTADMLCWNVVYKSEWCDIVLWGNHDRAVVQNDHAFSGYTHPNSATRYYMSAMRNAGRLKLAHAAHGHLLTHAGLHKVFKYQRTDPALKFDVEKFVDWINNADEDWFENDLDMETSAMAIRDCIGRKRGGASDFGGILWRDARESLYPRWPQVFGHTKSGRIRTYNNDSYCIDIGSPDNGALAGMWLPERSAARRHKFVQINRNYRDPITGEPHVRRFPA